MTFYLPLGFDFFGWRIPTRKLEQLRLTHEIYINVCHFHPPPHQYYQNPEHLIKLRVGNQATPIKHPIPNISIKQTTVNQTKENNNRRIIGFQIAPPGIHQTLGREHRHQCIPPIAKPKNIPKPRNTIDEGAMRHPGPRRPIPRVNDKYKEPKRPS